MDFHQLECLVAIAENGTVSKAAEILMFSQPALTRTLKSLEEEIGFPLFERSKNRLVLNEYGKIAVQFARDLLDTQNRMVQNLNSYHRSKQRISIGSCAPAPLWGIAQLFRKQYPDFPVDSEVEENERILLDRLKNHKYSTVILTHPVQSEAFTCLKVFHETLHIAAIPEDPLSKKTSVTFEELNGTNILVSSNTGYWNVLCKEKLPDSLLLVQNDLLAYKTLMEVSTLVTFRTNLTIPKFRNSENRIYIPVIDPEATLTFYLIYPSNKDFSFISSQKQYIHWENYQREDM